MAKRFERKERYRVRLTKRDLAIVEAVFEARYLTNELVFQLFFKPTAFSWCKQRMRYLFDLGYLKKRQVHINEPDFTGYHNTISQIDSCGDFCYKTYVSFPKKIV